MKKAIQYNLFKENDKFNYSYFSDEELLEILISDEESAQTLIKEHKNLYNVFAHNKTSEKIAIIKEMMKRIQTEAFYVIKTIKDNKTAADYFRFLENKGDTYRFKYSYMYFYFAGSQKETELLHRFILWL